MQPFKEIETVMNEIDFSRAMQSVIDENSNTPTEDLIMNVTACRWECHVWALAGFEKILEERDLPFNIYTESFFKKKFVEKFSQFNPGWAVDIRKMITELIENGWNLSIPITAKNYHGSFECFISTDNIILQQIVEASCETINLKCSSCGHSEDEYLSDGVCENCKKNYR